MATKKSNNAGKVNPDERKAKEVLVARRKRRQNGRGESDPADWHTVDPDLVLSLIAHFTAKGGVVSFSYTRDQGAYRIGYYIDGESDAVYIRPTEDVDKSIEEEVIMWSAEV